MAKPIPSQYDKRAHEGATIEFRETEGGMVISGLVVPFKKRSVDLGGFTEEFRDITPQANVLALWSHDSREVLGSTDAGNLKLEKRESGLWIELRDPAISGVHLDRIKRGILPNASFGFEKPTDEVKREEGQLHRIVRDAELIEVSVGVAFPAYKDTDITAAQRSIEALGLSEEDERLAFEAEQDELRGEILKRAAL